MKHKIILSSFLFLIPLFSFGWGADGHKIVADIAQKKLNAGVEAKVQQYLDSISFEKASVWMDEIRSDHSFDYMKTWHYVNIEKGESYAKSDKGDLVSELQTVISELKNYKLMKNEDVQKDLKILFHLCGDITQLLKTHLISDKQVCF